MRDPRTVARDIPGVCDILFPRLLPGLVGLLNRKAQHFSGITPISTDDILHIDTNAAMLFEVAFSRAEQILFNLPENMDECIRHAVTRQKKYFDANTPSHFTLVELSIVRRTADNLVSSLFKIANGRQIEHSPRIPGFEWIANGVGDFSCDESLIEVKCTAKGFSSNDYRQLLIYWLLSYASSIEKDTLEWKQGVLLNPRLNRIVVFEFDELLYLVTGGTSKVEILELFRAIVSEYTSKLSSDSVRDF